MNQNKKEHQKEHQGGSYQHQSMIQSDLQARRWPARHTPLCFTNQIKSATHHGAVSPTHHAPGSAQHDGDGPAA